MQTSQPTPEVVKIRAELQRLILEAFGSELVALPTDVPILDLGISSLALVEGMRRVYDRFGVLVSIRRVIEGQVTLGSLALYIEQELINAQIQKKFENASLGEWKIERELELSNAQRHLAFLCHYSDEANAAFNEALVARLNGALHAPALQAAVDEAAQRFEALRTAFSPDGESLHIGTGRGLELQVNPVATGQLDARLKEVVSAPFESGKRLFRGELLRLSESEHVLVLVGHALVLDQHALLLVFEEVARLYNLFRCDLPANVAPTCLQWADYLALARTAPAQQAREQAFAYWREQLPAQLPRLELPADHPRPAIKKYSGTRLQIPLGARLEKKLTSSTQAEYALQTASVIYIERLSQAGGVIIGVESSPLYPQSGLPALAATRNLLPLIRDYDAQRSFASELASFEAQRQAADEKRQVSLSELIQILNVPRDQSRSPLFSLAFRSLDLTHAPVFDELQTELRLPPSAGARYDLEFFILYTHTGIQLACDGSLELFDQGTLLRWLNGICFLLEDALDDPAQPCGLLPMLTPAEMDLVLKQWNHTEKALPDCTVYDLICEQAALRTDQTAVLFGESALSYTGVMRRSDQLAAHLQQSGVQAGERVGVLLRRSLDLLPALLAAWRLGAVYVPIDSTFPSQRMLYMLEESRASAILTTRDLLPLLGSLPDTRVLLIDEHDPMVDLPAGLPSARPGDGAILFFTSGSTGKPKAVDVRHRALLNILLAVRGYSEFSTRGRMLALTTSSFDISCAELFLPLMAGGLVEIAEDGLAADGLALNERLLASHPTHVQATPSTWKALLSAGWKGEKDITLMTAGEAISRELAEELLKRSAALWNLYGPTETTVYSAFSRITPDPASPVCIGRPVPNTRLYILDAQRRPLPVGAIGELYIGGLGISPGYWQQPALTGERFLPDPFLTGERIYRTGDLARFNPTGEIICLGRADEQVKIHGVRIELGEIESNLRRLSGVQDAVVSAWRDPQDDYQLVAHVIHGGQMLTPGAEAEFRAQLRAGLRERLPDVMVPPHFLFPASFPMTANGKVQRSALPVPGSSRTSLPAVTVSMPLTSTEELLAEAWADVLGIDKKLIGRNSDFMDMGGHSLLMTRLMVAVRKLFQVNFSLRELFAASRLEQFAALIDERRQKQVSLSMPLGNITRDAEWARQRMTFLTREAELPQYISPARGVSSYLPGPIKTVLLTGATGFLGAYLVAEILNHTEADLFCLVRARRGLDARQRIEAGLRKYRVWGEDEAWQHAWQTRFHVVEGDVTLPHLGLDGKLYAQLARQVDAIFHSAAHVNFIYPYEALRATNVLGIHEIIQFAFHARIKPVHHLSTAAIWPMGAERVYYERDPIDHYGLLNLGYDETKWVGEKCLLQAAERGLPVARYRPGEVGGDSRTGHCVTDHFLIAAFKGFLQFGAFPLMDIGVDVAPVDYVARAMVHLAFRRNPIGRAFHLTNPFRSSMSEALTFLRGLGYEFQELPFEELRDRLLRSSGFSSNALFAYQAALEDMDRYSMELPTYDTRDTLRELSGSGISCPPADERLFGTYFRFLQTSGFIPTPTELNAAKGAYA